LMLSTSAHKACSIHTVFTTKSCSTNCAQTAPSHPVGLRLHWHVTHAERKCSTHAALTLNRSAAPAVHTRQLHILQPFTCTLITSPSASALWPITVYLRTPTPYVLRRFNAFRTRRRAAAAASGSTGVAPCRCFRRCYLRAA
jgi:hypothetical protein